MSWRDFVFEKRTHPMLTKLDTSLKKQGVPKEVNEDGNLNNKWINKVHARISGLIRVCHARARTRTRLLWHLAYRSNCARCVGKVGRVWTVLLCGEWVRTLPRSAVVWGVLFYCVKCLLSLSLFFILIFKHEVRVIFMSCNLNNKRC